MIALDDIDRALARALWQDGSASSAQLAQELGLSQSAVWRRIKRLEASGVISGYELVLDASKAGYGVTVFLGIKLAKRERVSLSDFERAVGGIPEVQSIELILGVYDYRLRVIARDLEDFERILRRRIMTLPAVGDVEANVLLSEEELIGPLIAPLS